MSYPLARPRPKLSPPRRSVSAPPTLDAVLLIRLTPREREIAYLVATGASNKEIARALAISIKTVKNALTSVFVKTDTRSRSELAVQILRASYRPSIQGGALGGPCLCVRCALNCRGMQRSFVSGG